MIVSDFLEAINSVPRNTRTATDNMINMVRSKMVTLIDGISYEESSLPNHSNENTMSRLQHESVQHKIDNVKLLDRMRERKSINGTLFVTATHLIFLEENGSKEKWILHSHISEVEKLPLSATGCPLKIRCKTFHIVTFIIPRERSCMDVISACQRLMQPACLEDLQAFTFNPSEPGLQSTGWNFFDLESEYLRMGVPNAHWTQSHLNEKYELCDTYPKKIFVPANCKQIQIIGSSKFRSRGRLPVLCYLHRDNQAAISRCSQPLAGFSARCLEDEQLLNSIYEANPGSTELCVVDTRPKINAMANKAAGKGYENENHYSNIKFHFVGIENIHVMRTSLNKLIDGVSKRYKDKFSKKEKKKVTELKNPTINSYLSAIESSSWLKHIRTVLETSVFIANKIIEGTSVLVHCSDGWDRTAQTCSLASLMLDPHYRTLSGFEALVEKEWLSFGHKFTDRCHLLNTVDQKEESPVFTQFLDAVWQMSNQFPTAFQFNERFLLTLHDEVMSSRYGTFIGNCEKDRIDLRLSERTYSLWGHIANNLSEYINPLYKRCYESEKSLLVPNVAPQYFSYWKGLYNRFESNIHTKEDVFDVVGTLSEHNTSLEDHILLLERRVQELARLLGRPVNVLSQKLQGLLSAESLHCLSSLLEDGSAGSSGDNKGLATGKSLSFPHSEDGMDDHESGFEDGSSLSKSHHLSDSIIRSADGLDNVTLDQISEEMGSVALNLTSLRNKTHCSCSLPFDHHSKKYHCWKCGDVFCSKCIRKRSPLAGHYSQKPVSVCKDCHKSIRISKSIISLQQYAEEAVLVGATPTTPDNGY